MPFRLKSDESLDRGVKRIAREQIDRAIGEIDDSDLDRTEAVHQVRKRCKKLRGLLRLVREPLGERTYRRENVRYRDLARSLATLRDADTLIETYDRIADDQPRKWRRQTASVRAALVEQRDALAARDSEDPDERLSQARQELAKARRAVGRWSLAKAKPKTLNKGMKRLYAQGRKAMTTSRDTGNGDDFHDWRKRVKYHSFHLRLLTTLWPRVHKPWRKEVDALAQLLGDEHDLTVLEKTLEAGLPGAEHEAVEALRAQIETHRQALRDRALNAGARLFAEKPKAFGRRWRAYWRAWRADF